MNEEAIKLLYDDISSEYEVGTIDDFKSYLLDSNKRSAFFNDVIKERYDVSSLDEFENAYGLKKKEDTQPVSSEPQEPLQEASSDQLVEPSLESGEKIEEPQLSFESLPDVDAEISAIEKELEEVYANVDKQYTPEEIQSVKDKNARRLELSYKKDNFLAKEGAININGQYFSPEGFESELVKRYAITPTDRTLKNEGTPIYGKGYTHSEDLSQKESEINRLTKEIDDLGKDEYLRYHYNDLAAARKPLEEERIRLSKEYAQAVKSNNDILTYENGGRYYEGDRELTQSEFYDAITSMRGADKLSDGINNFRVENDPGMQEFLNFQEKYAKVGRAKEAVKGYLSTTKTFIDGVDTRQVEAYMGVAELFGVDPKEAAKAFSIKNYPGDPITKEPGYSVVSPVVTEAIKNASKRTGDFTDNFLQEYSKIIRKQTEDVKGHRMVREFDAIDRLLAGDFGGFAADVTQLSVESAPFLVAAMAGTAGIGLIYNSVQAQSYYEYRDLGNSKARAMELSNLKAAIETADAFIERALFTKSISDVGKILNRSNAWTKFGDGVTRKLAYDIAALHAKELPTEYAQGTIGSMIDQMAKGQKVDFWKASRDGMIEMMAAGPTTTVMSSPQIAQAIYAPIAKFKDIHNIKQDASKLLLELTVGEQDKKIVLNSLKGIVNDIVTENKKVEELDKVVTPEEKSMLRDLTLQELTSEAALETDISEQSKEAIRNKLKDIERQKNELISGANKRSSESKKPVRGAISPESSKNYANLTEDEAGNFVFYHVSPEKIDETDPSKIGTAKHGATSSEEARELSKVGGVTMFYTRPEDGEQQVSGNYKHEFRVAKNRVYDFNSDPLNFAEEAKKRHEKEYPGKAYDANTQLAYITQIAGENGFDIVVSEWAGKTRAQTTQKLKPSDVQVSSNGTISKSFQDEFVSNTKKGWMQDEGVSPVNKLVDIYNKIYKIFNEAKNYGKLYKLGDLAQVKNDFEYKFQPFRSQEEVTEAINESDKIPQEIKDEYNAALSEQGVPPSSRLRYEDNPQTEPVDIDNGPEGTYINVGMMEEESNKKLTKDDIIRALPRDIEVLEATELTAEESSGEPTLSLKLSRPLDANEMKAFRNRTKQKAVPQLHNKRGVMHGSLDWGNFNAEYFTLPDKQKLNNYEQKRARGNKLFGKSFSKVSEIADRYYKRVFGSKREKFEGITKLNKERAKRIAKAYEEAKHDPNNKEVKKAYNKLVEETLDQFKELVKSGIKIEINNSEPYNNVEEMVEDLENNSRLKILSTESEFGDTPITDKQREENPLLSKTGFTDINGIPLLANDMFRAVHDFFGHAELGNGFGPIGEENAWNIHARMFSPLARRAMTTETRGQNSWVNFSGVNDKIIPLREKARQLRRDGKIEEAKKVVDQIYEQMSFAEQKITLLPKEFSELDEATDQEVEDLERMVKSRKSKNKKLELNQKLKERAIKEMNEMEDAQVEFKEPEGPKTTTNPLVNIAQKIKTYFGKPVKDLVRRIEDFNGIPMFLGMSDMLAAGEILDIEGKPMTVNGGLLFGLTGGNKNLSWAGVNKSGAQVHLDKARLLYERHKDLFERLWKEGKLPDGHIPMAIMRMANRSILSNEAIYRYVHPLLNKASKTNNKKALSGFRSTIKDRIKSLSEKKKKSSSEIAELKSLSKINDFLKGQTSMADMIKSVYEDSITRSKTGKSKLNLSDKAVLTKRLFGSNEDTKSLDRQWVKDMFGDNKDVRSKLTIGNILNGIADPSVKGVSSGSIIGIMGIDVKYNPGISTANHNNYGWGANGRIIALMENPTDGINVFPEFFAKAAKLFKKKKDGLPDSSTILRQIGSTYFHDKAFLGTRPNEVMSEIDIISAKMRYAFPSVQFTSTQEEFDEAMSDSGIREKRNLNGDVIAGITRDGKIHLNPSVATISTPIHEFAHIWMDYLRSEHSGKKGTELYEKGMELVEGTEELERAKELYPELDLEGQKEEALVELIATRGASIMEAGKKSKFLSWLNAMYEFIKKNFSRLDQLNKKGHKKIKDISLEDFADTALADLLSGKELSSSFDPTLSDHAMSSRFSKKRQADMSMYDIVKEARLNNFTDGAIKRFLQKEGYAVKDIMDVLDVPIDTLTSVPKSFGLIEGGMNRGVNLYTEIRNKLKRLRGKSIGEIRAKAQEYLAQTDDYKNSSDTLQKQMAVDLDKSLAITQNKEVSSEMKAIRAELRARNKGAKELSAIKSKIRTFIRKNIPMSMFEKKEVMELVSSVTEATPENIQSIFKDVEDFVVKHGVKIAKKRIEKLLNIKLKKLESGRLKGNFLPEDQDLIEILRGNLLSEDASIEDVQSSIDSLRSKYSELDSKNNLTQREYDEMVMLDIAINYNNSLLMDENDVSKLQSLNYVKGAIEDVLTGARIEMKIALAQQKEYYNKIKGEFFKDVTGLDIDFNDENSVLDARQKIRDRQAKKDNRSKFVKYLKNFFGTFDGVIIRIEGMEGLLDRVSRMPGEMFEGKSTELILDKIDESNANFKAGKREIMSRLDQKAKEIFGDKYRSLMQKNSKPTEYYYSNPKKVDELFAKLEEAKSDKEKGKIQKEIDTYRMPISQNEMYYIYNQYKDEANHPGLEATFGPQYGDIISLIEHKLDPKVKQWADWQVEEFFPSVYDRYNSVYREVYRTDMPWNENYAGRIHRDGDADQVNLLENTDQYQTSVGGGSTKVRIKNKKKIKVVDGDTNLNMYINEMEFFASYAESVRDISKMIGNPDIKDGIIATTGKEAYVVLKTQFDKIMNRNSAKGSDIKILNTLSNAFVKAKLGLSPVIFLKQTTSALAFADYIGYRNWSKNMLSLDLSKQWRELYENSVYLQDRYEVSDIAKVLEDYTSKDQTSFLSGVQSDKLNNFLMYMIKQGDKMGVMGSIPNYKYYKELYMSRGMTESDAIALAVKKTERQIKTTQQSNDIQDKDLLQTSGSLMRMLNLFLSSPRALMRKEIISIRNLYRKMRGQESKGSTYENLRTFFTYHVVIPSFFQFVSLGFPGLLRDWRDDDSEDMAWAMLLGNINAVFAFGDIAVAVKDTITNKPWAGNMRNLPMFQNIEDIFDSYSKFMKAKTDETRAKYMTKLFVQIAEPASGIPINNIMKFGSNYSKLATGDVDNFGEALLRFFNYSDYVIEGPKESKSTSKSTSGRTSRRQTSRRSRD